MRPARLERATYSFGGCHSIQLSYGRSSGEYSGATAKGNVARAVRLVIVLLLALVLGSTQIERDYDYDYEWRHRAATVGAAYVVALPSLAAASV